MSCVPQYKFEHVEGRPYAQLEQPISKELSYRNILIDPPPVAEISTQVSISHRHPTAAPITDTILWFLSNVKDLESNPNGENQLRHLKDVIMPRLDLYRSRITRDLGARSTHPTWSRNVDSFYNP